VSFRIEPFERVAIVGKSGAGKSTLIDLVLRFYDPRAGVVSIGGVSVTEVSESALKDTVALISQDVFLFDGTILENILDGNREASEEDAIAAARLAALDDLIDEQDGLGRHVGPSGRSLSGGQRQRIGIARALVKKARIYVFDEATSALDAENERRIMLNLRNMAPATVLFVTHRISTLRYVDRVLMLEEGKIVAFDSPDAIEVTSEAFRRLFNVGDR
jgi:ATP-binding cassette, subfamily B, bacterial MsbA